MFRSVSSTIRRIERTFLGSCDFIPARYAYIWLLTQSLSLTVMPLYFSSIPHTFYDDL